MNNTEWSLYSLQRGTRHSHDQKTNSPVWLFFRAGPWSHLLYLGTLTFMSGHSQGRVREYAFPDSFEVKVKPCDLNFSNQTHPHVTLTLHCEEPDFSKEGLEGALKAAVVD